MHRLTLPSLVFHGLASLLVFGSLASSGEAQNLIRNGDFGAGTTGWSFSGHGLAPKVMNFDTTGTGSSTAFSCLPGQKTFGKATSYDMTQRILAVRTTMEFAADVAVTHTRANGDGGTFTVFVADQKVGTHRFGRITGGTVRARLCFRFVPTKVAQQPLKISMSRVFLATVGLTPRVFIDNISLRIVRGPSVCPLLERKVLARTTVRIVGPKNCAFALLIAPKRTPRPIPIPGFGGGLELDLASLLFLGAGSLGAQGQASIPITAPVSVAGVMLHWQAISVCTNGKDFGPAASFGYYR